MCHVSGSFLSVMSVQVNNNVFTSGVGVNLKIKAIGLNVYHDRTVYKLLLTRPRATTAWFTFLHRPIAIRSHGQNLQTCLCLDALSY